MISKAQEDLRNLCKRKGPKGGEYMIPGCEPVYEFLAAYRYAPRELEIISKNIKVLTAKAEQNGTIPLMTADGPVWVRKLK